MHHTIILHQELILIANNCNERKKTVKLNSSISAENYFEDSDLYYRREYECGVPLLQHAVLTATSSLRERGPENARLNGKCFFNIQKFEIRLIFRGVNCEH